MNSNHSKDCNKEYYSKANQPCCLDAMIKQYGIYETAVFCKLNAFKYKYRRGKKPTETWEDDTEKMVWYINKYNELMCEFYDKMEDNFYGH